MTQYFDLATQSEEALVAARDAVAAGQCIVLPTDTVYGIGANPFSPEAVMGLLNAKHRGPDMPPPVLIAEPAMLGALVQSVPDAVHAIVEEFWPGPLTVILKAQEGLNMDLGETAGTVAVRVPDDDAARQLLREVGPLAVSSANISGEEAATTCERAREMLGDSVAVYLDGGPSRIAVASTIVDFATSRDGRIVRTGVISAEQLHLPEDLDA